MDRGAILMKGTRVLGILCYPPQNSVTVEAGVFMKLLDYESWITMATHNESERNDEGRIFRIRGSCGSVSFDSFNFDYYA